MSYSWPKEKFLDSPPNRMTEEFSMLVKQMHRDEESFILSGEKGTRVFQIEMNGHVIRREIIRISPPARFVGGENVDLTELMRMVEDGSIENGALGFRCPGGELEV